MTGMERFQIMLTGYVSHSTNFIIIYDVIRRLINEMISTNKYVT